MIGLWCLPIYSFFQLSPSPQPSPRSYLYRSKSLGDGAREPFDATNSSLALPINEYRNKVVGQGEGWGEGKPVQLNRATYFPEAPLAATEVRDFGSVKLTISLIIAAA